ncbi:MAG: hypothetical protein JWM78_1669 [Verrucomicrobiaceae bacterium]|nr:hypothetical protein [Verrucomicrobiaceae bacterium]
MSLLTRKRVLLAKIESVYGTDPTPTGAANAVLIRDLDVSPMEAKNVSRDVVRPFFGNSENLPGTVSLKLSFGVEIAGSGTPGTAPAFGPLLRACGFSETVVASTRVEYAPVSTTPESVTLYANYDGVLHKGTGCRGTVSFDFSEGAIPAFKFEFTGVFNPVVDGAAPTPTYTAWQRPLPANRVNTPTFTLHSFASVVEKLSLDIANAITFRSLIGGVEQVLLTDRKPAGSVSMEATTVATKDWWTTIKSATTGPMQLVHGLIAGNIFQIDAPAVQITSPKYADKDGVAMLNGSLVVVPVSGNDEIKITIK